MKLLVVSNAPIINKNSHWFAYSPYVTEIEIWAKHSEEIAFACPILKEDKDSQASRTEGAE